METTKWTIDPTHSEVGFTVKHMMITKVNGTFDAVNATIESNADFKNAYLEATIETASINTRNEQRDGHLKSPDFFDVENHPVISFKAELPELKSGTIQGEFTMHGVTKTIPLNLDFYGEVTDPWGNKKTGLSFESTINRKDFGLGWNAALEAGGVLVSEDVKLRGELQFVKNA